MPQYFENADLGHKDYKVRFDLLGKTYELDSDVGVFSNRSLDKGTRLLIETIGNMDLGTSILDLGCGLGPIGLILAALDPKRHVTCSDVNERALELTRKNARKLGVSDRVEIVTSDVYSNLNSTYDLIVSNPPIRAGKKVTYAIYDGAPEHLKENGKLIVVVRKAQGADSLLAHLREIYKEVGILASKKGYKVIIAAN